DLKRKRAISTERVLKSLARRFSIIDLAPEDGGDKKKVTKDDFSVFVDGTKVSIEHWDIIGKLQYMWLLGPESERFKQGCADDCMFFQLDAVVNGPATKRQRVSGWI